MILTAIWLLECFIEKSLCILKISSTPAYILNPSIFLGLLTVFFIMWRLTSISTFSDICLRLPLKPFRLHRVIIHVKKTGPQWVSGSLKAERVVNKAATHTAELVITVSWVVGWQLLLNLDVSVQEFTFEYELKNDLTYKKLVRG